MLSNCKVKKKLNLLNIIINRFPDDVDLKEKWIQSISSETWIPEVKSHSKICSEHFESKKTLGNIVFIPNDCLPSSISYFGYGDSVASVASKICDEPSTSACTKSTVLSKSTVVSYQKH